MLDPVHTIPHKDQTRVISSCIQSHRFATSFAAKIDTRDDKLYPFFRIQRAASSEVLRGNYWEKTHPSHIKND